MSDDGVDTVESVERRAAGAGLAFVARVVGVAVVVAACFLQEIAAGGGHVAELRRRAGEQCFREDDKLLADGVVPGEVAVADQCADAETAVGERLDAVEG